MRTIRASGGPTKITQRRTFDSVFFLKVFSCRGFKHSVEMSKLEQIQQHAKTLPHEFLVTKQNKNIKFKH